VAELSAAGSGSSAKSAEKRFRSPGSASEAANEAVEPTAAQVLQEAAAALRRIIQSGTEEDGLQAVARVAQLLEAASAPVERAESTAEEEITSLTEHNAFLLGQIVDNAMS
jgi:hypothetical protein